MALPRPKHVALNKIEFSCVLTDVNFVIQLHGASCTVYIIRRYTQSEFLKFGTFTCITSKPLYQNMACHLKENE